MLNGLVTSLPRNGASDKNGFSVSIAVMPFSPARWEGLLFCTLTLFHRR